ncbi:Hypp8226 [Branchiostoma lanceolatum]|uniref:Hypp8226 protein n=1 Tax=Branchiostoma lanceolatum TaxID=7740 RepID=A0A8K0ED47_BRALA|nr:Hypp8226 [Branchiostoma lanceolatum]
MYAWQSVCVYIRKRGQRKEPPPPPSPPNPSEQGPEMEIVEIDDEAAREGYLQKTAEATAGILQHNGAARDLDRSNVTDVALRNRERLQPSEHKRPAFLSSEDEEVFNAYYRKVSRRSKALNTCDTDTLDERNRGRAAEILDKRYMSSESNAWGLGPESSAAHSIVRRFPWESKSLLKLKDLDEACPPKASSTHRKRTDELTGPTGRHDPQRKTSSSTRRSSVELEAVRFVLNRHRNTLSVSSMLGQLQRAPPQDRRHSIRLTILYKIQHGRACVRCDALKPLADSNRSRRGHSQQFQHINCRTDYRLHSSSPAMLSALTTPFRASQEDPPLQAKLASARALTLAPDDVYCLDTCPENGMEDDDMVECCLCRRWVPFECGEVIGEDNVQGVRLTCDGTSGTNDLTKRDDEHDIANIGKEAERLCTIVRDKNRRRVADERGVLYVDNEYSFQYRNGQLDESLYDRDRLHISRRRGASRLVSNINEVVPILPTRSRMQQPTQIPGEPPCHFCGESGHVTRAWRPYTM